MRKMINREDKFRFVPEPSAHHLLRRATIKHDPKTIATETNDCAVRAFSNVLRLDYDTCHAFLKAMGRQNGYATPYWLLVQAVACFRFEDVTARFKSERIHEGIGLTTLTLGVKLQSALPSLKFGRYLVQIESHIFAVVNGKVLDSFVNNNARIINVWRFEND